MITVKNMEKLTEKEKMNTAEVIAELVALKEFFDELTNATPVCIEYAIDELKRLEAEAIPTGYIENRIAELTILITEHGDFIEYDEMVKVWIHEANSLERLLKKWREREEE